MPERMKEVEVYYGYYLGDAQVWDSEHFRIPLEDDNERAIDRFQEEFEGFKHPIAFMGILSVNEDPEEDEYACPSCGTNKDPEETCPNPECQRLPESTINNLKETP